MIEIIDLQAYCYPLGGEIDITWVFNEPFLPKYSFYIFKSLKPITNDKVLAFFKEDKRENFLDIRKINTPELLTAVDFDVETGTKYYYAGVTQCQDENNDNQYTFKYVEVTADEQELELEIIPTKKLVEHGIKKVLKVIGKDKEVLLEISNKFPMASDNQTKGISIVRATSESAYRFWSNLSQFNAQRIVRGEVEAQTINVTWWTMKNQTLRDKITDIMSAARFSLERYLQLQYETGVQVALTMQADNEEYERSTGEHMFMSGMFVYFLIENKLKSKNPNSFLSKLKVELNFTEQKP